MFYSSKNWERWADSTVFSVDQFLPRRLLALDLASVSPKSRRARDTEAKDFTWPPLAWICPSCEARLQEAGPDEKLCTSCQTSYPCVEGIWRCLPPDRNRHFDQFTREYIGVRKAEGRGSNDSTFYRSLPHKDLSGRHSEDWRIRSISYQKLIDRLQFQGKSEEGRAPRVLDLGAGNGWLSYRLTTHGHQTVAVDLLTNKADGLGAQLHYPTAFTSVQAEFDHLPFDLDQFGLIIFNASFHYATNYEFTLSEALRVLESGGRVVVMDSPVYRNGSSGEKMVREREATFYDKYGFASNSLPNENFLTYDRLRDLGHRLSLNWQFIRPFYGLRWALRPWRAGLLGRREPASFLLIVGTAKE